MQTTTAVILVASCLASAGCASSNDPVVYGQARTVGLAIGLEPGAAFPKAVLGYDSVDIAVLPTERSRADDAEAPPKAMGDDGSFKGGILDVRTTTTTYRPDGTKEQVVETHEHVTDTYSTIGQFAVEGSGGNAVASDDPRPASPAAKVGLGSFFATGLAAQRLSGGFACAVADGKTAVNCHKPTQAGETDPAPEAN